MFLSKTTAAVATVLSVLISSAAAASTVTLDAIGANPFENANGKKAWVVQTSFQLGTDTVLLRDVGMYRLEATRADGSTQRLRAVGLQPLEDLQFPIVYDLAAQYSPTVLENLNTLSKNAWGLVFNENSAAAFQLAAWEIANETGVYDINDGFFKVTGDTTASDRAAATAQTWLENIANGTWTAPSNAFDIVSQNGSATLLTNRKTLAVPPIAPVPLPASAAFLLAGVIGLGGLNRFKRACTI